MIKKWKLLDEKMVFENHWWKICQETVELPDGSKYDGFFVNHSYDGVAVLPITERGTVLLNTQYKQGAREIIRELCVGRIEDGDGPEALAAGKRELLEETGYGEGNWEKMTTMVVNPTSSRSRIHIYAARGVRKIREPQHDPLETIEVEEVDLKRLREMMANGEIISALTCAVIAVGEAKGILTEVKV